LSEWQDAFHKLEQSYKQKEAEVVAVAEIGNNLLEQNKKLEEEVSDLKRNVRYNISLGFFDTFKGSSKRRDH
jgi:hypothetical protein